MGLFGSKKKKEHPDEYDDKQKYIDYIKSYRNVNLNMPQDVEKRLYSRDYKLYRKNERMRLSRTKSIELLKK